MQVFHNTDMKKEPEQRLMLFVVQICWYSHVVVVLGLAADS